MRDSLINTCGMKMRKLLDKKSEVFAQKYGVRNVELEILLFLYHSPCGDTAKDIVEEKNLSKAHISKSVDNLRAKGFVVLTEDENDRRKRHIELTEKAVEADICSFNITRLRLLTAASTAASWINTSLQSLPDSIIIFIDFI